MWTDSKDGANKAVSSKRHPEKRRKEECMDEGKMDKSYLRLITGENGLIGELKMMAGDVINIKVCWRSKLHGCG